MWNKDELRGKAERMKGQVEGGVANVTNDERLRDEGAADEAAGAAQEALGKGRRKVGNAIKDLGNKIGH